jgi:hypothetical protein
MKNIHVLPTDNPSRLILQGSELVLSKYLEINEGFSEFNQHIYITSDEEIKVVEYGIDIRDSKVFKCERTLSNHYEFGVLQFQKSYCKKIILTTDQDLIKDGVQAIDNEFLEWFVKNPSCDEVEVGYGWIRLTETDNEGYWVSIPDKQFEMQQEEPKQDYSKIKEGLKKSIEGKAHFIQHFKNGGTVEEFKPLKTSEEPKQEKMYSEEEVLELLQKALTHKDNGETGSLVTAQGEIRTANFYSWFEQNKKK